MAYSRFSWWFLTMPLAWTFLSLAQSSFAQQFSTLPVAQVINQSDPGSGFLLKIGSTTLFVTAKHVLGRSVKDIQLKFPSGSSISIPFKDLLPIADLDAAIIVFKNPMATLESFSPAKALPNDNEILTVWGYPLKSETTNVPLTSSQGPYLGVASNPQEGYELLYGAKTMVGYSGGPILDMSGNVVGVHGRAESTIDRVGVQRRTGNALGIPIRLILQRFGALKSDGKIDNINIADANLQAAHTSLRNVYEMYSKQSFGEQVLAELDRAQQAKIPIYCIATARAYYYIYFSELPDTANALKSLNILDFDNDVSPVYYAMAGLVAKRAGNYQLALKMEGFVEKGGRQDMLTFSERRIKSEVVDLIRACSSK
jgi:hypothetical protein